MNNFTPITFAVAVDNHIEGNGGAKEDVERRFRKQIAKKVKGAKCASCRNDAVWALGGTGLCFTCTTGEVDASDDFEFDEVCF